MRGGSDGRRLERILPVLGLLAVCVAATWFDGARLRGQHRPATERNLRLAADLGLTDLCLFADAPWLRHLAVADVLSSVQDGPGAFDYSRGGALVGPRDTVTGTHGTVAEPTAVPR